MNMRAGLQRQGAGRGFTLIEVLLATVLLLLLMGAIIFGFSALERGVRLDEGASQFEALLRFARAHAASTGRQVRVLFEAEIEPSVSVPLDSVRVTWEPDPLGRPGVFEDLAEMKPYTERINELVRVFSLKLLEPETETTDTQASAAGAEGMDDFDVADFLPPLRFFPDGSSDSAEIILASRDEEDVRQVRFRLVGMTGTIRRSMVEAESKGEVDEKPDRSVLTGPPAAPAGSVGHVAPATSSSDGSKP
jgi:prepilin-type N-terminal cleavage/methylation domain-containing protein